MVDVSRFETCRSMNDAPVQTWGGGLLVGAVLLAACGVAESAVVVKSPTGVLVFELSASEEVAGPAHYRITHGGSVILDASALGLELEDADFSSLRLIGVSEPRVVRETYTTMGIVKDVEVHAVEQRFDFENHSGDAFSIIVRITETAVGFRYLLAHDAPGRVMAETTTFSFAETGEAWIQPHDLPSFGAPAYEALYANGVPIGHGAPVPSWNLPALFHSGKHWVLLAESDTSTGNFGAHLWPTDDRTYRIELPQPSEGLAGDAPGEPVDVEWQSPWRLIVVSADLYGIVESTAVTDFARSAQIEDTAWIKPGRVSWSWWSDHDSAQNPAALRSFIDFSAEMGWEYTLIDANWTAFGEDVLRELVSYARTKDVGVFLWYNSGGSNNIVTEGPRDRMHDREIRRREMAWLADVGVVGIKIDFFQSDRVDIISRYIAIAEDAAAARLIVNFHGSTAPKGWERTYPNVATMEAVRGAEQYFFEPNYPADAVWHNTILPFTRNVVGPMDYTPVTFSNQQFPRVTTAGHELALSVAFESPLQHFADSAGSYLEQSTEVIEFLKQVPVVWDESRLIDGFPGEYFMIARRSGDRWWVAGINGELPRTVDIDVSRFVGLTQMISGPGLEVSKIEGETITVDLGPGDGFVVWSP